MSHFELIFLPMSLFLSLIPPYSALFAVGVKCRMKL